jgi:branched-subunit amino acid aminotransferase/4-amino-4-deoxychorismate lyase
MRDVTALVEVDGRTPSEQDLQALALAGYGHFTAMQVRDGRVRGLDLHLRRLALANRELFGAELDGDRVRDHVRSALEKTTPDASVRVLVQQPDDSRPPTVTVVVRPPFDLPGSGAWSLQSVPYQRCVPHIKHIGDFGQAYYGRLASGNGYDEALLTAPDGTVAEGSITNVGFFDGTTIIWPDAPQLAGITMQLLRTSLPHRSAPVRLADLARYPSAFVTNSRGIAAVRRIDEHSFDVDQALMDRLNRAYGDVPWDKP